MEYNGLFYQLQYIVRVLKFKSINAFYYFSYLILDLILTINLDVSSGLILDIQIQHQVSNRTSILITDLIIEFMSQIFQ